MNDLAQFRETKMEQAEVNRFDTVKVTDREHGEALQAEIAAHRAILMKELTDNGNAQERQIIHDVLYELKTVRNKIGSQITAIGRANILARRRA